MKRSGQTRTWSCLPEAAETTEREERVRKRGRRLGRACAPLIVFLQRSYPAVRLDGPGSSSCLYTAIAYQSIAEVRPSHRGDGLDGGAEAGTWTAESDCLAL